MKLEKNFKEESIRWIQYDVATSWGPEITRNAANLSVELQIGAAVLAMKNMSLWPLNGEFDSMKGLGRTNEDLPARIPGWAKNDVARSRSGVLTLDTPLLSDLLSS